MQDEAAGAALLVTSKKNKPPIFVSSNSISTISCVKTNKYTYLNYPVQIIAFILTLCQCGTGETPESRFLFLFLRMQIISTARKLLLIILLYCERVNIK